MDFASFFAAAEMVFTPALLIPTLNDILVLLLAGVVGLTFYAYLTDRTVFEGLGRVHSERFGPVDALLALLLATFFSLIVAQAVKSGGTDNGSEIPDASVIVNGSVAVAVLFLIFITVILAALRLRAISWRDTFGLTRVSPPGILGRAVLLLLLAYPLIGVASNLSDFFLATGGDKENSAQEMVRFFAHSKEAGAKWVVAVSAVLIAPIQEEFLFRGYIYGVVKRYGGVVPGVFFNAALFAAIHVNLPAFAPLFVLAVCLTLAYEWTGSIWVSMCMHSLFNLATVVNLLRGGSVS